MHIADDADLDRSFLESLWPATDPLHVALWLEAMLCVAFRECPLLDDAVVLALLHERLGLPPARRWLFACA